MLIYYKYPLAIGLLQEKNERPSPLGEGAALAWDEGI